MPMPPRHPHIEPVIPDGYLFVAVTTSDPAAPVAIMGWPTKRRDTPEGPFYLWPVTQENVELRCQQENLTLVSWRIVRYGDLPKDRAYRDAWADVAGAIAHNIPKAREIHRGHLRVARAEKLAELDAAYLQADEANNQAEKKRIAAHKQRLRDLPADPAIEAAQTVDDLKAFWPEDLR